MPLSGAWTAPQDLSTCGSVLASERRMIWSPEISDVSHGVPARPPTPGPCLTVPAVLSLLWRG